MTSKFLCSYGFHAIGLIMPQHLTHPTFKTPLSPSPFPPIGSLSPVVELRIFPVLGLDKEILNLPPFLFPLITPETQTCYILSSPHVHTSWSNQPWGNNNILFSDNSIAPTYKIKVYAFIDSEHKFHQKGLYTSVGIEIELPVYFCAVLTSISYWPDNCLTLNFFKIIGIKLLEKR